MLTEPWVATLVGRAVAQDTALARVGTFGVLAHDREVQTIGQRLRYPVKRSVIDIEVEPETNLEQQTAFQYSPGDTGITDRGANRTQQNRIETAKFFQRRVVEYETVAKVAGRSKSKASSRA